MGWLVSGGRGSYRFDWIRGMQKPALTSFERSFRRRARAVRQRLAGRAVLTGLAAGALAAAASAALLWWLGHGALRVWVAGAVGLLGAVAGFVVALRRRWSDGDVALFLDARLDAREAISTAVELAAHEPSKASGGRGGTEAALSEAREIVVRDASQALAAADAKALRPRVLRAWHGLAPVGGALAAWLCVMPLPPRPPPPPVAPGARSVKVADLKGLDKIIALDHLDARDAEQRKRLHDIAERARKLRARLAKGMPRRDALADIAKLRDDIAAERLTLGNKQNRAGTDAAVRSLASHPALLAAARALGDGDLTEFDRQMRLLANKIEKKDREEAKQALEDAAKAAREHGSKALAQTLEDEKKRFAEREADARALRDLAKALHGKLSKQAERDLQDFGQSGSPEAEKRLADALGQAVAGLSDAERKRLAEQLGKQLAKQNGDVDPMTKQQIDDLAKRLATPEGKRELTKELKKLANPAPSGEAERQHGLDQADRGGAEAERRLGGLAPIPLAQQGGGAPRSGHADKSPSHAGSGGPGGPGSHHDTGTASHKGHTDEVHAGQLRAKASTSLNPGAPMYGATLGRAPARAGETANQQGTGALGRVGPTQIGGVERSRVPEEYRQQVSRYFRP